MCGLSNIFWWRDGVADSQPVEIRPPEPLELQAASRILLGYHGEMADESVARGFIQYAAERGINLGNMIVAASGKHLLACCLPIFSTGRTALLMTSNAGYSHAQAQAICNCIETVINRITPEQARLVQLLLDTDDQATIDNARKIGFHDLATLIYLQRAVTRAYPAPQLPDGFSLIQYNQDNHSLFSRAIQDSYEKSLDCPDLHGKREMEDIIAGHKAAGEFTPSLWFCLLKDRQPVGVLLLGPSPAHSTLELVYIGLSTEVRGKNLGDYFLNLALYQCHQLHLNLLTLAVDSCNKPATQLYYRHGLTEVHRRHAMMLQLPG